MTTVSSSSLLQMRANILTQNDALQRAAGRAGGAQATDATGATSFGDALMDAVKAVNTQQTQATQASEAYERGETNDLVGVMLARQKASVSFEATLQVRNKLLGAYRDIMNMPV
jgi:flagellar hook-basal body complex protein FliE